MKTKAVIAVVRRVPAYEKLGGGDFQVKNSINVLTVGALWKF